MCVCIYKKQAADEEFEMDWQRFFFFEREIFVRMYRYMCVYTYETADEEFEISKCKKIFGDEFLSFTTKTKQKKIITKYLAIWQ